MKGAIQTGHTDQQTSDRLEGHEPYCISTCKLGTASTQAVTLVAITSTAWQRPTRYPT